LRVNASVLWTRSPDEDREETPGPDRPGEVDESFAARRLRRWIKGMFGGKPPESGRGNQEAPPTEEH
jgi:hypothetical protein